MAQASPQKNSTNKVYRVDLNEPHKARVSVTIKRDPLDVYNFWRDFSNLPLFMKDLKHISVKTNLLSHWTVQLKSGAKADWHAEIIQDVPGSLISWSSIKGSEVQQSGSIFFEKAKAEKGTIVRLNMDYHVPGGKLTEIATALTGESPQMLILTNLRRLKALLETGEIPTTDGQSSGREEDLEAQEKH